MIQYGQMCEVGSGKTKWLVKKKDSNKVQRTVNDFEKYEWFVKLCYSFIRSYDGFLFSYENWSSGLACVNWILSDLKWLSFDDLNITEEWNFDLSRDLISFPDFIGTLFPLPAHSEIFFPVAILACTGWVNTGVTNDVSCLVSQKKKKPLSMLSECEISSAADYMVLAVRILCVIC